ncbi:hypothetical protein [Mycobacterium noviomagense]|nr:hypothetical protein [Mycobacterium noviomagense]
MPEHPGSAISTSDTQAALRQSRRLPALWGKYARVLLTAGAEAEEAGVDVALTPNDARELASALLAAGEAWGDDETHRTLSSNPNLPIVAAAYSRLTAAVEDGENNGAEQIRVATPDVDVLLTFAQMLYQEIKSRASESAESHHLCPHLENAPSSKTGFCHSERQ